MTTDEDLLWPSQRADFHCRSQEIATIDLDDEERTFVGEAFDAGEVVPSPVQVTARNLTDDVLIVESQWDGVHLDLDVTPTSPPMLALRPALRAVYRYHYERHPRLVYLVVLFLAMLALTLVAMLAVAAVATL
jgi:hypothetical protein